MTKTEREVRITVKRNADGQEMVLNYRNKEEAKAARKMLKKSKIYTYIKG